MRITKLTLGALLLAATATPAFAQEETEAPADPFTITGSATVVSDYRFRGFSQSNEEAAIQGGFTVAHESGLYVGTWGSSIGFANGTEIDVFAGFAKEIASGLTADIGATLYLYPGVSDTSVIEPYFALTGTVGPATIKGMVAYAPGGQDSLGDASAVYTSVTATIGIPETPFKLKGSLGHSWSDSYLGGYDGDSKVLDYSVGVEATWKVLTLGVSYVNTNEDAPFKEAFGADGAVLFTLGAAF
ncbi:TorF family putative porin [Sphingomonas sp. LT1P40]|uniref:TorF family putative porin n=1 Tax=Alteristakelama amylovorans TaxID=3096166 RepID=UPI002FCB8381